MFSLFFYDSMPYTSSQPAPGQNHDRIHSGASPTCCSKTPKIGLTSSTQAQKRKLSCACTAHTPCTRKFPDSSPVCAAAVLTAQQRAPEPTARTTANTRMQSGIRTEVAFCHMYSHMHQCKMHCSRELCVATWPMHGAEQAAKNHSKCRLLRPQ